MAWSTCCVFFGGGGEGEGGEGCVLTHSGVCSWGDRGSVWEAVYKVLAHMQADVCPHQGAQLEGTHGHVKVTEDGLVNLLCGWGEVDAG
jgi:hypothetical protein